MTDKVNPKKGLTIFQRLFLICLVIGSFSIITSGLINFRFWKSLIEEDLRGQIFSSFKKATSYFNDVYRVEIEEDIDLIATNPLLDNFLMSDENEVYLTKPGVEKFLLHFTQPLNSKYLSGRFIDAKGKEVIITRGSLRDRRYTSITDHPPDEFYQRLYCLFERLKFKPLNTILFEKPFFYDNKLTFFIGSSKFDPESGVFGGTVIFHCDLTPYLEYLSTFKFRGISFIGVYTPSEDGAFTPAPALQQEPWFAVDEFVRLGSENKEFLKIKLQVPAVIFNAKVKSARQQSLLVGFLIMLLVGVSAFLASRHMTRPLHHLVQATKKIASGDLTAKVEVLSSDEIGQLSQSFNEMMDTLKKSEERLQYEAFHDVLTALPNRSLLLDRLDRMIERNRRRPQHRFAVLFVDLDRFKNVNDSLGHTKGDELLIQISERLKRCLRSMDTIARLGGDEFIILMDEIKDVNDTTHLAERILNQLKPPFLIDGQEIYISASIGISLSQPSYVHPSDYLRDTDTAMYHAKSLGKARYQVFDVAMHTQAIASLQMESDLRSAVDRQEFEIYYQPIISLKDRRIVCLEALLRWRHPRRGLVYPAEFISLAEETGLICAMGRWVTGAVCRRCREWREQGIPQVPVAINFSARQFEEKDLIPTIKGFLADNNIAGQNLIIEITESIAMQDVALSIAILNELRGLGIKISVDDFGIGYSSLSSLKLFPIDSLKIDRTFITDIIANPDKAAIIKAIIVMAHSLGYTVVAEGIEIQAQVDFLTKNACDEGQGLLFSPALPLAGINEKLRQGRV